MWAAKLRDEGGKLVKTCDAMCDFMKKVGVAIDGGKDSLSMAAKCGDEVVKAPGTLVITAYAPCNNIYRVVTPNLKAHSNPTTLLYIRMNSSKETWRLGGSALGQCFRQIGDVAPKIDDPAYFRRCFVQIQRWVHFGLLLAGIFR
jgi:phosphoribosylformylglycinamidine synthase